MRLATILMLLVTNAAYAQRGGGTYHPPPPPPHFAQCVEYVGTAKGLVGYPDAYKWPAYLVTQGYKPSQVPVPGAIMVCQPNVGGAGYAGHVALIQAVTIAKKDRNSRITFAVITRGANQGTVMTSPTFTELNCTNVALKELFIPAGQYGISFWVK